VKPRLTLFDLDGTLLEGDSDVLWCDFLMDTGVLDRTAFGARNADMEARYRAGTVGTQEFADFYVSLLAGRTFQEWQPLRERFLRERVAPRIPARAAELVQTHVRGGDLVVITTATNRFITELTATHLGVQHLIAIEPETHEGTFTGRTSGVVNMREGKVARLHEWLARRGRALPHFASRAYSDSVNDLPLLECADEAIAVNPDARLEAIARERGWAVIRF
jgi:HAD superfamily hydrolase (TIGR01490 family)